MPDNIKSIVIQQWLAGNSRDKIAFNYGTSTGAVWNIVNEWKSNLSSYNPDELRDLAVTLKRVGIDAGEYAAGLRVATILGRMGVQEDYIDIESFMSDIYNRCCNELGLTRRRRRKRCTCSVWS
ncbi:MAG TPA: hypothetical protein VE619_08270 [Nitrososphaeraceae archaeon]|nr:hypothetical protein [Nitrososphaeraceae archaeon]